MLVPQTVLLGLISSSLNTASWYHALVSGEFMMDDFTEVTISLIDIDMMIIWVWGI